VLSSFCGGSHHPPPSAKHDHKLQRCNAARISPNRCKRYIEYARDTLNMRITSRTRVGGVDHAFKYGTSQLFNKIARLTIVYEDFRLEFGQILRFKTEHEHDPESTKGYEFVYLFRRMDAYKRGRVSERSDADHK
jgi:hypothetical protein